MFKRELKEKVGGYVGGVEFDVLTPPNPSLGDYSVNAAFVLAKKEKKNPKEVAAALIAKLQNDQWFSEKFERIEFAPPGYINFHFKLSYLQDQLGEVNKNNKYGQTQEGKNQKVIVEYPSLNVAKPAHVGHLRSAIIGDALANVYEYQGYDVIRWNYIGDWGTQFGKLIAAYKRWRDEKAFATDPMGEMLRLYVKFHDEAKSDPELEKEGQKEFKKLEEGDAENRKLWELFREKSLGDMDRLFGKLGLNFKNGIMKGESDYELRLSGLIKELKDKGLAKESEGALIVDLEKYVLPPALLRKSDGATLYLTRDIATLEDRIQNFKAEKILYVVANQQALHFEQLFAIAKELGWSQTEPVHVKFGMVLGEDGKKLATREGKTVSLREVLDRIIALALETVKQKNPNLSDEEENRVAQVIGLGALKYNDLKQHPYSDITFDWKAMLDLSGNSGPYIQYTYARLKNILNKSADFESKDLSILVEPEERVLMRQLLDFPEAISECARQYTLNGLALFLYEFSHRTNQFYEKFRILDDENLARKNARLFLIQTVSRIIKDGLALLGIETLDRI